MVPTLQVTVIGPHSFEAMIFGSHAGKVTGLQPKLITPFTQLPLNEGGVTTVQLKVRVQVMVCPHAVAENVKTCERLQPFIVTLPAEQLTGTEPQLFEAVTVPPKLPLAMEVQEGRLKGLHPRLKVLLQLAKVGVGFDGAETVKVAWHVEVNGAQVLV